MILLLPIKIPREASDRALSDCSIFQNNWIQIQQVFIWVCIIISDMLRSVRKVPDESTGCFHDHLKDSVFTVNNKQILEINSKGESTIHLLPQFNINDSNSSIQEGGKAYGFQHRLSIIGGKGTLNTSGRIISSCSDQNCMIRGSIQIQERTCWQFYAPVSLYNLQFGVCHVSGNGRIDEKTSQFTSSTPRTVTFLADNGTIKMWVNHSIPVNKKPISIDYEKENWYPFVKIKGIGVSVIYNPFASEPNTSISIYNPFNTHSYNQEQSQIFLRGVDVAVCPPKNLEVDNIYQLDDSKMLIISKDKRIKIIQRDEETNKIDMNLIFTDQENRISNLLSFEEWQQITQYSQLHHIALPKFNQVQNLKKNGGIKIDDLCELTKYLVISFDRVNPVEKLSAQYQRVSIIIYHKLLPFIGQYMDICNPIHAKTDKTSEIFFSQLSSSALKNMKLISKDSPWFRLEQNCEIIEVTQNYLCVYSKPDCKQTVDLIDNYGNILVYLIGEKSLKLVFKQEIVFSSDNEDNVGFNFSGKQKCASSNQQSNLWKQSEKGPSIYKILDSCFSHSKGQGHDGESKCLFDVYEVKDTDIRELVQDFNIEKELAITSLQECGNVEDALLWISDPDHKKTRKRKSKKSKQGLKFEIGSMLKEIFIIEFDKSNYISRLIIKLFHRIYLIGIDQDILHNKYLQKSQKGFINLASLSYCSSLQEMEFPSSWYSEQNHSDLKILDSCEIKRSSTEKGIGLFYSDENPKNIYFVFEEDQMVMKKKISVSLSKVYFSVSSISIQQEPEPFSHQMYVPKQDIVKTITGQWFIPPEAENITQPTIKGQISLLKNSTVYSSFQEVSKEQDSAVYLSVYMENLWNKSELNDSPKSAEYLPLIVENGPPGCNMNYPICSILYPKSSQPFLANYPFSLTFRHLHRKHFTVNEILIKRMGSSRKNVNQIKEGYVYFSNVPSIANMPLNHFSNNLPSISKKYKFDFTPEQTECHLKINEENYWEFMIIEPVYSSIKKLPFQIGFVGGKGRSIDNQVYENQRKQMIQANLSVFRETAEKKQEKCRYEIQKYQQVKLGMMKVNLRIGVKNQDEKSQQNMFQVKVENSEVIKYMEYHSANVQLQSPKSSQLLTPTQICELSPQKIIEYITKPPYKKYITQSMLTQIFQEFSKNDDINFKQFSPSDIRKLIDLWQMNPELDLKEYQNLLEKVLKQSEDGAQYIYGFWIQLGNGYVTFDQKYLGLTLLNICKYLSQEQVQKIIIDLVQRIETLSSPTYEVLTKSNVHYLFLQADYYSHFYYEQLVDYHENKNYGAVNKLHQSESNILTAINNKGNKNRCEDIYHEQLFIDKIQAAVVREQYLRKIFIKVKDQNNSYSCRNMILRFDKSELYTKAIVNIYAYEKDKEKSLVCREIIQEHQWIQITKNPYRQEMQEMFKENTQWLNALGFTFPYRVKASYYQIQIMFSVTGLTAEKRQKENLPYIDIVPQLYGKKIKQKPKVIQWLDQLYFNLKAEEKYFVGTLPLHLNLKYQTNEENGYKYNKYLVNKNNSMEYNLYEIGENNESEENEKELIESMVNYKEKIATFADTSNQNDDIIGELGKQYRKIIPKLNESRGNSPMRISRKISLDYCYTTLLLLLQTILHKQIQLSQPTCQQLLAKIIQKVRGPVSSSAFFAIIHHSQLFLKSLAHIRIVSGQGECKNCENMTIIQESSLEQKLFPESCLKVFNRQEMKWEIETVSSLINLLTVRNIVNKESISYAINLLNFDDAQHQNHIKFIDFVIKLKQNGRPLFFIETEETLNQLLIRYLINIARLSNNSHELISAFTKRLSEKQMEALILLSNQEIKKEYSLDDIKLIDYLSLLVSLLFQAERSSKPESPYSIQIISIILSLQLTFSSKWEYLSQCIQLFENCNNKQEISDHQSIILSEYLSVDGLENPQEIVDLVIYHQDILNKAIHSKHHGEQLVNFLKNLIEINKQEFVATILRLPQDLDSIHISFYDIIIIVLNKFCNFGGAEGAKLLSHEDNVWLSVNKKMMKMVTNSQGTLAKQQICSLVRWYLMNNPFQKNATNPINRSPALNNISFIADSIVSLLTRFQDDKKSLISKISIKSILQIFNSLKQEIKSDTSKLNSGKFLVFNRLKFGLSKLLENSVSNEQLSDLLMSSNSSENILQNILNDLLEDLNKAKDKVNNAESWEKQAEVQLGQDMQGFFSQGSNKKEVSLNVKDWQAYKGGSKTFTTKIGFGNNRLKLKPKGPINLTKFAIGILVQQTPQRNSILPDSIQLYGSNQQNKKPKRICELIAIQDQNYYQYGVKVFGINFNTLNRKFKNVSNLTSVQLKFNSFVLPSCSDTLENNQKTYKNSMIHISFISALGYDSEPLDEPSYTEIYMKILSFLSYEEFQPTLKALTANHLRPQLKKKMIKILSARANQSSNSSAKNNEIEQLLIKMAKAGVNVLQQLLNLPEPNSKAIKTVVANHLNVQNLDLVLANTLHSNFSSQSISNLIENIKILSYQMRNQKTRLKSKFSDIKLFESEILSRYKETMGQTESGVNSLYKKLIACIMTTPQIFDLSSRVITESLMKEGFYSLVAAYIINNKQDLNWFIESGELQKLCDSLIKSMGQFKQYGSQKTEIEKTIELIYSLSLYKPINNFLVGNDSDNTLNKFPIKVFQLLENKQKIIEEYPNPILKHFINFFRNTCVGNINASNGVASKTSCSQDFARKLIELMVKIPEVSSQYHHTFIHQFFFPLINTYEGIPIYFRWKHSSYQQSKFLNKSTSVLNTFPIRSNNKIIEHDKDYYELQTSNWQKVKDAACLLFKDKHIIATKTSKNTEWKSISPNEVLMMTSETNQWELIKGNQNIKIGKESQYAVYIHSSQIVPKLIKLLTNQTLLRVSKPSLFGKKYLREFPINISTFDHIYWLPLEITPRQLLKQVNICGYKLSQSTINSIKMNAVSGYETFSLSLDQQIKVQLFDHENLKMLPLLDIQIEAYQLFKDTTVESISQSSQLAIAKQSTNFIPQQTIFKVFQSLSGLEKMIKVMMSCVKNWNSAEQSKIWLQYLTQLQSFSCFPVFSSIYMTKQENVNLLFSILSGLPDKEDSKKWLQNEKEKVKSLYDIIKNVFEVEGKQAKKIREFAISNNFFGTMLERLHLISKEPKREKVLMEEEQQVLEIPTMAKKSSEEEYKKEIKKKKGVGYGTDNSSNTKWDITGHQEAKKELSEQILGLFRILQKFLDYSDFQIPSEIIQSAYSSALLPIIESSLRGGSLLQISKNAELFKGQLKFIKVMAKRQEFIPCMMDIPKEYEPKQPESIYNLLKTLQGTSKIFISCLTGSASEKVSEEIAKQIIETFRIVQESIESYKSGHVDEQEQRKILELPLAKKYPILMKDLRFDYVDMKDSNGKMKHHYSSSYQANHTSPSAKTIRLAQELADISHALPIDHTNAIYVRCDKQRVDFMQALIMGSNGTPYAHGAYLFDIHFEDNYPNNPPKVNLTTTGSGSIRFNPNLYACGKVCLSLLGTWRGSAMQNWDSKVSTLLQVLVSIQSIIMAEDVYFNQPGFEHQQGTVEGEKKNEAYSNVVRYGNIKFAMLQNIKNPPKGFETVIKRHFYLKKSQILEQCKKWLKYAQKRQASYNGLVSDHNSNWCNTFRKKDEYKKMMQKAIEELENQMNKLPEPSSKDLNKTDKKSTNKSKKQKKQVIEEQPIEQIDVTYDSTTKQNYKELDINDEKVKDRWSRYIGAMGIEAVNKQSKANILLFGLSPLGIQIAKNIVLSGCRKFAVCDQQKTSYRDLAGQFYLTEDDIGKNRVEACLYKLQELNTYVRVESCDLKLEQIQQEKAKVHEQLKEYDVIINTTSCVSQLIKLSQFCHQNSIKFIATKCEGPYGYVFNDFGPKFEVTDKNGEQTIECMIENISNDKEGVLTIPEGQRHPYEDGQAVIISKVKGMMKKEGDKVSDDKSINQTIHRITVINKNSFKIGDTTEYTEYEGNGLVRNMKLPISINFKDLSQGINEVNIDSNLEYYDFEKGMNNRIIHNCFNALSTFIEKKQRYPAPWNWQDSEQFLSFYEALRKNQKNEQKMEDKEIMYVNKFSFTCGGSFAPLCAFYGGLIAQEAFKAITSKYMPINQFFFTQFSQIIPQLPQKIAEWEKFIHQMSYKPKDDRFEGLRTIVGEQLLKKIRECRVFVIGSGAIGCELLKNYAMINLATSDQEGKGEIIVTDPDHIETSNLNRQFLFREKHIQKPKSATAAAAVKQMNKYLQQNNKIKVKLLKVCEATKDIFSNEFFQSCDIVTNALDNVQARQYVDMRCVQNKIALLQSGTLSSKGHVQVIIPYKTQTYGSKADPAQDGQIPHCTLKMFPEETLHCVEWARDIFGKNFSMKPKSLQKLLQTYKSYQPNSSEKQMLKQCLQMLEYKPNNFDDAVSTATHEFYRFYRNDIKQLLYTYPLDAKGKDGKDFWKLPKRPPTQIETLNSENPLHRQFITSFAVMLCKVYNIPYPKNFRAEKQQIEITKQAMQITINPFVPSDKVAKEMASEIQNNEEPDKQQMIVEKDDDVVVLDDAAQIFDKIKKIIEEQQQIGNELKITPEQFEKDEDGNGHIDLIYSMANLRANNYKLDPMDWITTKLKAGRITPALSTTTSCIAGLQTIELVKYLAKLPLQKMKNCFLNLAVPIIQSGQPGEVQKIKIHEQLQTNIWERWQIDDIDYQSCVMQQLIEKIEEKYKISVKSLAVVAGGPIFSDLILGLESKAEEKKKFLASKFKDVLNEEGSWEQGKYVDLSLVMGVDQQFIKHVPTIRIGFKK